eukprot:15331255-Ditylum_brightwellii.AAC.1
MGVHAMHPGSAPGNWVKPGHIPEMGYRSGIKGMMENKDVVKKKELKSSRIHKCSAYCLWKNEKKVKFDPKKHADSIGNIVCDKNGNEYVYVDVTYCRMDFGEELKYDQSGGNDRTRGKPFLPLGKINFDNSGMP